MALSLPEQPSEPVAAIIRELETAHYRPSRALSVAVEHADEIAPVIIELVDKAADGVILVPQQRSLLFWGIHVLAAARCTTLYRPLLRLVRHGRQDTLDQLLGDAQTETLPRILISVFDGDSTGLIEACAANSIDGYIRWSLLDALTSLTFAGRIPRETTVELLTRFEQENLAAPEDAAWEGWQDAVAQLGVEELYERVRATWRDGRSPSGPRDQKFIEELFAKIRVLGNASIFARYGREPIDDPVEALAWTAQEMHKDELRREKAKAAADPAAEIALQRFEQSWLAHFLRSDKVPANAMTIEQLDGFFHALICCPSSAPAASEYMQAVWNPEDDLNFEEPNYDSDEQAEYVASLLSRHWDTVALRLDRGCEPELLWERDEDGLKGRFWAGGFIRGVAMCAEQWGERRHEPFVMAFLDGCITVGVSQEQLMQDGIDPEFRDQLFDAMPQNVVRLYYLLRGRPDPIPPPVPTHYEGRKIGRNERCPCGSGKKFKRCCGSPVQTVH
jgi:yecA family protein